MSQQKFTSSGPSLIRSKFFRSPPAQQLVPEPSGLSLPALTPAPQPQLMCRGAPSAACRSARLLLTLIRVRLVGERSRTESFHPTFVDVWLESEVDLWSGAAHDSEYSRQMPNEPALKNWADGAAPLRTHSCLALPSLCTDSTLLNSSTKHRMEPLCSSSLCN
jgi:hypothetical protein